jgi:hypothetical protein
LVRILIGDEDYPQFLPVRSCLEPALFEEDECKNKYIQMQENITSSHDFDTSVLQ